MKFTPEHLEQLKQIRENHPEFSEFVDTLRKQFPGSKVVYLAADGIEFGEKPDGNHVVPHVSGKYAISKKQQKQQRPMTVGEKRRAMTRYKGDS